MSSRDTIAPLGCKDDSRGVRFGRGIGNRKIRRIIEKRKRRKSKLIEKSYSDFNNIFSEYKKIREEKEKIREERKEIREERKEIKEEKERIERAHKRHAEKILRNISFIEKNEDESLYSIDRHVDIIFKMVTRLGDEKKQEPKINPDSEHNIAHAEKFFEISEKIADVNVLDKYIGYKIEKTYYDKHKDDVEMMEISKNIYQNSLLKLKMIVKKIE